MVGFHYFIFDYHSVLVQFHYEKPHGVAVKYHDICQSTLFISYSYLAIQNQLFLFLVLVTMTLALPDNRVGHFQCGFCSTFLVVDGRGCQKTRDCKGQHADCSLDEVAWYKASFSIGKHGKPCCSTCIQPWDTWIKRQNNKVESFMKYGNQICEGCIVTLQIPNAPAVAVAAVALVAAAPAAAPTPQPVQFPPPPPPPPPQPQNISQALITLRTMETKVAVLEVRWR